MTLIIKWFNEKTFVEFGVGKLIMLKAIKFILVVVVVGSALSDGFGQINLSLPPQSHEKIRGFRLGEFRLVPILGIEGGYDSNIFRQDSSENPRAAGLIQPEGGLVLRNPAYSNVSFSLSGMLNYKHYFSDLTAIKRQNNLGATVAMKLHLFPRGHFGLNIEDTYQRTVKPRNYSTTDTLNRHFNSAMLDMNIRPGGGVLTIKLYYGNQIVRYDDFSNGDFMSHKVGGLIRWDFLPKTSFIIEGNTIFYNYSTTNSAQLRNIESHPVVAQLGLVGYITPKLVLDLRGGFTKGFYKTGPDYTSWVAKAGFGYYFTPSSIIELGYRHYFDDSYYSNYYETHRAYFSFKQQLWGRLNIDLGVAYNYLMFAAFKGTTTVKVSDTDRRDNLLEANINLELTALRYLGIRLSYKFYRNFTDFSTTSTSGGKTFVDKAGYMRHYILGGIRVYY